MNVSPVNPDQRTLPPGWNEHYDVSSQTWYYIWTDCHPPRVFTTHPLGLPIVKDDDVPLSCVPGTKCPVQAPSLSPAQLYASGSTTMKTFAPPSLPAPGMPFLTPSSSPNLIDRDPVHLPKSDHLASPHSHNRITPMLTTKAEARDEHKFTKSVSQVHMTAAPPPYTPPHAQFNVAACISPSNTPSMTASKSNHPQQHVLQTPLSQSQSTINHTRQRDQSVYSAPQSSHATLAPSTVTQTAAQQLQAQEHAQRAAIVQAQAIVIRNQQKQLDYQRKQLEFQEKQLVYQQQQLALQQQMDVEM
ncbi:hypothetical protein C0992_002146 [Termitomyces sp. T32_za158]|nr:hypothetical protein C0992_002146 [Termitomyces sp. T32_za158]